jgi:uroporphyrin-III C-methyltransferase / precorrin-2 dehydrogenase / sirohydrochlorin ferrochelatase
MEYFPITVQMKNRLCLIVGGGDIATRKLMHVLKADAKVIMVSRRFSNKIRALENEGLVSLIYGSFDESILSKQSLQSLYLIIAATDNNKINKRVSKMARSQSIWVNVVDDLELSTFIMPAVIDRSPLLIAVSSSGVSPVLARMIREKIEWLLPKSLGKLLNKLKKIRPEVKKKFSDIKQKRNFSEWFIESALMDESHISDPSVVNFTNYQKNKSKRNDGKVYLVGAGPGDAELLTVKGLKLLQKADVVLYDALVSDEVLDCVRRDATLICVGKRSGKHSVKQDKTNQLLVDYAKQGLSVVRLKGGDPFIFGRGGEELEFLVEHSIQFEVVPGITAASGCTSYAGIPLTHRDHSQSVRFVTAHEKESGDNVDWKSLAKKNQTLVFYMGLMRNEKIVSSLTAHGLSPDTPVAIIQQGTTKEQRTVITRLIVLTSAIEHYAIRTPALIVIGEVVQLSTKLNWFKQGELYVAGEELMQKQVAN